MQVWWICRAGVKNKGLLFGSAGPKVSGSRVCLWLIKFMFSEKATKIDKIFTINLTVKIFAALSENVNFNWERFQIMIGIWWPVYGIFFCEAGFMMQPKHINLIREIQNLYGSGLIIFEEFKILDMGHTCCLYGKYRYIFFRSSQHQENMLCTKIVLNVKTTTRKQFIMFSWYSELAIFNFHEQSLVILWVK